jgi:hypothetical protein
LLCTVLQYSFICTVVCTCSIVVSVLNSKQERKKRKGQLPRLDPSEKLEYQCTRALYSVTEKLKKTALATGLVTSYKDKYNIYYTRILVRCTNVVALEIASRPFQLAQVIIRDRVYNT